MIWAPGARDSTLGAGPGYKHLLSGSGQSFEGSGAQFADVSSLNWAGLAETGATYTGVSASWTVPTVQASVSQEVASSWIGIDGYSNSDLIQTGTEEDTVEGTTSYYAWWEILPAPETPIFVVGAGDQMSAAVFQDPTPPNTWTIDITDHTRSESFSQDFAYSGPADSAEWIQEMTGTNPQYPLANFGTANFTNLGYATPDPAGNTPTLIRMVNSLDHTIAYPTIPGASDLTVTYGAPSTTTVVSASPGSVISGTSVLYSATVSGGSPSGSVTFSTGTTPLCAATLISGGGSCTSSAAPIGTDLIFGTYSGSGSASTGTTSLVVKAPTQTSVGVSPSPVAHGSSVTYSTTVTTTATGLPAPTGSVTFSAGSTTLCTATLSNGSGSCSSTAAPVGSDTVSGAYSGDSVFGGSTGSTTLLVEEPSQTAITASPSPVTIGSQVTYSATVTTSVSGLPTPTGSVTFSTGATPLCTATLSGGSGSCNSSAAPAGTDPISGTYSGDAVFVGSTGSTSVVINKAPTQTAVGAGPNPVGLGGMVTYSATVTTTVTGLPTPTGSVTFTTGATTLCTATLSGGAGACGSTAVIPVGTDTISGSYSGDSDFAGSNGSTNLVVNPAASQTSVGAIPSPVALDAPVTYSATVTASGAGLPVPTGSVTFTTGSGPTTLCTATLSNGSGSCNSSAAPAGTDTILGTYSGDTNFTGSTGSTTLVVEQAAQTAIGASPSPTTFQTMVTYSATVTTNAIGFPTPTGSVTFSTGSTELCVAPLSNGSGSCNVATAPIGTDPITGTYSGDAVFAGSTGSTSLVVDKAPSQTTIGAAPNSVTQASSVTYSATVTKNGAGLPSPSGSVIFSTGSMTLCTATLTNGGGSCSSAAAPVGSDTINGTYSGNGTFSGSSGSATLTVDSPPPPPPPPPQPTHGYWLVGSDGGIFTFGSAHFYGSTGSLRLQRPVVGIVPTADRGGYWLDASDGGIFAFGDAGFYGSIPGLGLHPAGSGLPNSLAAPIVGMVPSADGGGYFMVASDGGVFAFGDARFAGSCPGIGGCTGAAVAVMPDASGNGYWLVTQSGHVYTFGDAPYFGAPGPGSSPVTSAVRTPDGHGYWILFADGNIAGYGDAGNFGSPAGQMGGLNPAGAIFTTADGGGYWVAAANGAVANYGDAPNDGSMLGTSLNGSIIAATGW
jgi:hypothetical protein